MHPLIDQMREEMDAAGADASEDRPKLHIDGQRVDLGGTGKLSGLAARLCSVNAKTFGPIAERLDVERLSIVEMRGGELGALKCPKLTHLSITWATKLSDIGAISRFKQLKFLELTDTPKVRDLTPVAALQKLRALIFQGGMWNKNRAVSLAPISELAGLEVLMLLNLAVDDGGLRPLGRMKRLKSLFLSNQFETSDYAYLSVHLPKTTSDQFAAYQKLGNNRQYGDVMVTGKRKPFLHSRDAKDQARLAKYETAFEKLRAEFQAEIDHKSA